MRLKCTKSSKWFGLKKCLKFFHEITIESYMSVVLTDENNNDDGKRITSFLFVAIIVDRHRKLMSIRNNCLVNKFRKATSFSNKFHFKNCK